MGGWGEVKGAGGEGGEEGRGAGEGFVRVLAVSSFLAKWSAVTYLCSERPW